VDDVVDGCLRRARGAPCIVEAERRTKGLLSLGLSLGLSL
jgi:hypothetical protein